MTIQEDTKKIIQEDTKKIINMVTREVNFNTLAFNLCT